MYPGYEHRRRYIPVDNPGAHFHWLAFGQDTPPASSRAAVVLSAVGCALG
jgi:hypothetical protein